MARLDTNPVFQGLGGISKMFPVITETYGGE